MPNPGKIELGFERVDSLCRIQREKGVLWRIYNKSSNGTLSWPSQLMILTVWSKNARDWLEPTFLSNWSAISSELYLVLPPAVDEQEIASIVEPLGKLVKYA